MFAQRADGADGARTPSFTPVVRPKARIRHIVIPSIVALGVGVLLLISAGDVLRTATPVVVRPVMFTPDSAPPPERTPAGEPGGARAPRGGGVSVQAPGWLEADPYFVACTALADGVVEEVLALEGERVEAGQVVARLVPDDARLALARREADVASARAQLASARADLDAAQTDWDNPVQRERDVGVAAGAMAETDAELAQLPSLVAAERAVLDRLQEELARLQEAIRTGAANSIEVVILAKRTEAQAATLAALEARRAILDAKRSRLRAELDAARRNAELRVSERRALDNGVAGVARGEGMVAQAEAARDEAALRMARMTIRAPIAGFVQERLKAPGDKVMLQMDDPHSAHILHLYDPAKIQVRVDVPLADASHVFVGQSCEVIVEVLPDRTFAGEVTRITHEADLQKNTLQVKVRVIDPPELLKPEMLTRVKFLPDGVPTGASRGAEAGSAPASRSVLVALDCIDEDGRAWVVRDRRGERGVASPVQLDVGARRDGWAEVRTADLRPGDLVVVTGPTLAPGARVRVRAPGEEGGAS